MEVDARYPWLDKAEGDCATCGNTGEVVRVLGLTEVPIPCPDCPRSDWIAEHLDDSRRGR